MSILSFEKERLDEILVDVESRQSRLCDCASEIADAESALHNMKMEVHSLHDNVEKNEYNEMIKRYVVRIALARRAMLFDRVDAITKQRAPLDKSSANLKILQQTSRQLHDTEQVAVSTVELLVHQSEQITKSRNNMADVNANLNHANKLLNKMRQWYRG